jgi:hypothetical protein
MPKPQLEVHYLALYIRGRPIVLRVLELAKGDRGDPGTMHALDEVPFRSNTRNRSFVKGGEVGKMGGAPRCLFRSCEKSVEEPLRYSPSPMDTIERKRFFLAIINAKFGLSDPNPIFE